MGKTYITGDIHGRIDESITNCPGTKEDTLVVLGDCGIPFGYSNPKFDTLAFFEDCKELRELPFTLLFICGNHDDYDYIQSLPLVNKFGGKVRQMWFYDHDNKKKINEPHFCVPNVYYIDTPGIYTINNKKCLIIPGADSHDIWDGILDPYDPQFEEQRKLKYRNFKYYFRIAHWSWWEQEKINIDYIAKNHDRWMDMHFNYILTHEAPSDYFCMRETPNDGQLALHNLYKTLNFDYWFHGHMHKDICYNPNIACLYHTSLDIDILTQEMDKWDGRPFDIRWLFLDE